MQCKTRVASLFALVLVALAGCMPKPPVVAKVGPTAAETAAQQVAQGAVSAATAKVTEAAQIADEAYLYGYPLITGEVLRLQMSNVAKAEAGRAPMNSFAHARRGVPSGERQPRSADADTLVSAAWLDLRREPMVLAYPDMGKRWFSFTLHSQWMPALATLGSRGGGDTGNAASAGKATSVLISGPGWQGTVPKGMRHVRSPTRHVAILGRIQANGGDADVRAVYALQARLRIVPLSTRDKDAAAPAPAVEPSSGFSLSDAPRQAVEAMDTAAYFNLLAKLLGAAAPPAADDAPRLAKMARIGLEPGKAFDMAMLDPATQAALRDTGKRAAARMAAQLPSLSVASNGWQLPAVSVDAKADDLTRATIAAFAWPGPLLQEWLEATARVDALGKPLIGSSDYTLTFAKGQMPPVEGFWSISVYSEENGRRGVVPNTLERFALGTRDKLLPNADGSLTLQLQNLSPGYERATNWLPAPKGDLVLVLRLYAPRRVPPSVLPIGQGSWSPPAVRRAG